jgi:ABC-type Na+ efflux pump permease subunit
VTVGFIWSTTLKDLRRRLNDPMALVLWTLIPFAILALLLLAFGSGGGTTLQAHLLVADNDGSFLSGFLVGAFGQGPMTELVRVEQVSEEDGRERIGRGDGSAFLIIPEGFSSAVINEQPMDLTLTTNPAQTILPGILEEILSIAVEGTFYLQRLVGPQLRQIAGQSTDDQQAAAGATVAIMSDAATKLIDRFGSHLFPPLLELESSIDEAQTGPSLDFGALFFQSMFFMAIFFIAHGQSDDVWIEREQGTLHRALTSPQAITKVLAGKMLATAILIAAISLLALTVGCWLYDFGFGQLPLAVAWSAFSGVLLLSIFTLLQLISGSQRAGNILTSLVLFPLVMIGGSFFPFEAMPDWLAAAGRWTPNGWALLTLKDILNGTVTPTVLATAFAALGAMAAVMFVISSIRLRRGFAQS